MFPLYPLSVFLVQHMNRNTSSFGDKLARFSCRSWVSMALLATTGFLTSMPANAQASACAAATQITGPVSLTFQSTANGPTEYCWTAPTEGYYRLTYNGSNPSAFRATITPVPPAIGTVLIGIGLGSAGGFPVTQSFPAGNAGDRFLITLDDWGNVGTNTLQITQLCTSVGSVFPSYDCNTATPLTNGSHDDLVTGDNRQLMFFVCVAPGETASFQGTGTNHGSLNLFFSTEPQLCAGGVNGPDPSLAVASGNLASLTWTNPTASTQTMYLSLRTNVLSCSTYALAVSGVLNCNGSSSVTPYCNPMDPHSGGVSAGLMGSFSGGVGAGLHLEASQGPAEQFGYVLVGSAPDFMGLPFGTGRLCLATGGGASILRYNYGAMTQSLGRFDATGQFQNLSGSSTTNTGFDVPSSLPNNAGTIQGGDTWYFQVWFRDNASGPGSTGFTNALAVSF